MFVKHYLHFNIRFSVGGGWGKEKCFLTYWTNHARLSQITREVVGGKTLFCTSSSLWYTVVGIVDLILSTYFLSCTMPIVHWGLSSKPPHC